MSEKSNSRFIQHQSLLPQILQIIDKDAQSYIETSGLQNEISLTEFSEVMNEILEQRREEKTSTVSTIALGKETLEEQNDTTEKDKTEKTMSEQIRMANKEEQIKN